MNYSLLMPPFSLHFFSYISPSFQSRSSLAEFAQTQHELRIKLDALGKDKTRLQRELGSARAESERLKLEIVAANTKPENPTDNVVVRPVLQRLQLHLPLFFSFFFFSLLETASSCHSQPHQPLQLTVLKKALTQQTLEMTEIREKMRKVEADLAEAREDAGNARAAADAWKARLEEAEEAKRKAAEEMAESERQAEEARARAAEQSKVSADGGRLSLPRQMARR